MSELRRDITSGQAVILAPRRGARPFDLSTADQRSASIPPLDPHCPFCPGSEAQLPGVIAEVAGPEPPGWRVRVVPNRFAAVDAHEVVVESPRHDARLARFDEAQMEAVVRTYRDRLRAMLDRPGTEAVILFRNHGPGSGASLRHPHAQLIGLDFTPPFVRALVEAGAARHGADGRCPTCEMLAAELADGVRVVETTSGFVALVPFAAEHPGEVWILPHGHAASFADLEDGRLPEFAALMRRTLSRISRAYGDPAYNFVFDGADRAHRDAAFVHWRLRIAPRLAEPGGFELGAGMAINPSRPEADAARLRQAGEDAP